MEIIRKSFEPSDLKVDEGSREVVAVISSDSLDRQGEIVLPKGLNKKNYAGNPVVLLNHSYEGLPVGKALWVKSDGNQIIAKYKLGRTPEADNVLSLMQDGILSAHSIGFMPADQGPPTEKELTANPHWAGATNIIRKFELLEFSIVSVPANPDSIALAVSKGLCPSLVAFLGDEWVPSTCWKWTPEELAEAAHEPDINPAFAHSWRDMERQVMGLLDGLDSPEIVMRTMRGQI